MVVAVPAGTHVAQAIYVQGLAQGSVTIAITAGGPLQSVAAFTVKPSWVSCGSARITLPAGSSQPLYCPPQYCTGSAVQYYSQFQNLGPRAGLSNLNIGFSGSAPNVFTVSPSSQALSSTPAVVTLQGVGAGAAVFQLTAPAGFGPSPDGSEAVSITVTPPTLKSACAAEMVLGLDTQMTCTIVLPTGTATATSGDATLLLVSSDPQTLEAPTASAPSNGQNASFTIQALAAHGTAEILSTAPGYQSLSVAVASRPSQITLSVSGFTPQQTLGMEVGGSYAISVSMDAYQGGYATTPRAGASIPIGFISDTNGVVSISPTQTVLSSAQPNPAATLNALAPGSTLLRMIAPPSYVLAGTPIAIAVSQ